MRTRLRLAGELLLVTLLGVVVSCSGQPITTAHATNRTAHSVLSEEASPQVTITPEAPAPLGGPTVGPTYVPVLMYHYIRVNPNPRDRAGFILSVTPSDFAVQMLYLYKNGFHVVSLHEAVQAIIQQRALPAHPVVLTFDDGYRDFYTTAAPLLNRLGFTATDFIITGFTNRSRFMDWPMIEQLDKEGFTMADHTVNHQALNVMPAAEALWEMRQARQDLEAHLGHPVLDLAYPGGDFNSSVARQAQQLGFECALTTQFSPLHTPASLWTMTRVRVSGGDTIAYFASLVGASAPSPSWISWAKGQVAGLLDAPSSRPIRPGFFF